MDNGVFMYLLLKIVHENNFRAVSRLLNKGIKMYDLKLKLDAGMQVIKGVGSVVFLKNKFLTIVALVQFFYASTSQ